MADARNTPSRRALLLKAAQRMANYRLYAYPLTDGGEPVYPSCFAVRDVGGEELKDWYREAMLDDCGDVIRLWGNGNEYTPETYETRVLLLCMAAAAEKDL